MIRLLMRIHRFLLLLILFWPILIILLNLLALIGSNLSLDTQHLNFMLLDYFPENSLGSELNAELLNSFVYFSEAPSTEAVSNSESSHIESRLLDGVTIKNDTTHTIFTPIHEGYTGDTPDGTLFFFDKTDKQIPLDLYKHDLVKVEVFIDSEGRVVNTNPQNSHTAFTPYDAQFSDEHHDIGTLYPKDHEFYNKAE